MSEMDTLSTTLKSSAQALLLVDVISDFRFEDGAQLFERARPAMAQLGRLKKDCLRENIPVIYVNDPPRDRFASVSKLLDQVKVTDEGRWMLETVGPGSEDSVIIKPQHSGFFRTDLEEQLKKYAAHRVIVAGLTTDICVLFTAHDAFMRGLKVRVPEDCVAAVKQEYHDQGISFLSRIADADTSPVSGRALSVNGAGAHRSADSLW